MAQVLRPDAGELEVRIQARPETVFEFFVDPDKMKRWKGTEAELDPRPGGTYRVGGIAGGATVVGEFVEIDPPRRLVFTWGWEGDERGPAGLQHGRGDADAATAMRRCCVWCIGTCPPGQGARHMEGWEHFVPRLVEAATGRDPGPDPWSMSGAM